MTFLQKLLGSLSTKPQKRYYSFSVKCKRCGEIIEGRVDLDNDLSIEYEDKRDVYYGRKVLMGGGKCFQRLEATFKFTTDRTLIEQQVIGGEFV
jgi:lysyl-tRNA synthetase class I